MGLFSCFLSLSRTMHKKGNTIQICEFVRTKSSHLWVPNIFDFTEQRGEYLRKYKSIFVMHVIDTMQYVVISDKFVLVFRFGRSLGL